MTLGELKSKLRLGDFVELFEKGPGRKVAAGYCIKLDDEKFTIANELREFRNHAWEFSVDPKVTTSNFDNDIFLANWYEKHL